MQLKGIFWGSDSRWFLRGAEVWMGTQYLGDVSAEYLAAKVEEEIARLASSKRFELDLEPHRLGSPVVEPPPPPDAKEERRAARRHRRKRA